MEVPASIIENLQNAKRKDLQAWAKKYGIKANQSNSALIDALKALNPIASSETIVTPKAVAAEKTEESAFPPLIADAAPAAYFSPKVAVQPITHITPKSGKKDDTFSPKNNQSRRSTGTPKASPKTNTRKSVGTPKRTEIEFTFGSFANVPEMTRNGEETAIIASDETVNSDKQSQQSAEMFESKIDTTPETTTATASAPDQPAISEPDKQEVEAPTAPITAPSDDESSVASSDVSPRTRARVQQERAASRKAQLSQSNKTTVAKLVGGSTPKGKPITNHSANRPTASVSSKTSSGFKARPMPDFQKIHSKQFAQKASLDDFMAKRQADDENVSVPSSNVPSAAPTSSVSFKGVTTPRDKISTSARQPLRPTTPFVRTNSAPSSASSSAAAVTNKPLSKTSSVASLKTAAPAKASARPKFDLQASLSKPMTWKTNAPSSVVMKEKTNVTVPVSGPKKSTTTSVPRQSFVASSSSESSSDQGTKRKSLAYGGETAEDRRKRYGESLRRMSVVTN